MESLVTKNVNLCSPIENTELQLDVQLCCKSCGSRDVKLLYDDVADPLQHVKRTFSVYECNLCQIRFTFPVIKNKDLGFLYQTPYFSADEHLNTAERFYRNDQYRFDTSLFIKILARDARVIDIGCGNGSRVEYLYKRGYKNICGIDNYQSFFGKNLDSDKFFINLDPLQYNPKKKYDAILMYHVLEHLYDFKNYLTHISENILSACGFLVIQVPNSDCWQLRRYKNFWVGLDVPRHYWHFNTTNINKVLSDNGFEVIRMLSRNSILHPSSILNSIFKYDIRKQWQEGKKSKRRLQVEFLLLHLAAFPISVVENLLENSSILNVIARKQL